MEELLQPLLVLQKRGGGETATPSTTLSSPPPGVSLGSVSPSLSSLNMGSTIPSTSSSNTAAESAAQTPPLFPTGYFVFRPAFTTTRHSPTTPTSHPHSSTAPTSHPHTSTAHSSTAPTSHPHTSTAPTSHPHTSTTPTSHPHTSTTPTSHPHTSTTPTSHPHTSTTPTYSHPHSFISDPTSSSRLIHVASSQSLQGLYREWTPPSQREGSTSQDAETGTSSTRPESGHPQHTLSPQTADCACETPPTHPSVCSTDTLLQAVGACSSVTTLLEVVNLLNTISEDDESRQLLVAEQCTSLVEESECVILRHDNRQFEFESHTPLESHNTYPHTSSPETPPTV